jgi:hypothetical protein
MSLTCTLGTYLFSEQDVGYICSALSISVGEVLGAAAAVQITATAVRLVAGTRLLHHLDIVDMLATAGHPDATTLEAAAAAAGVEKGDVAPVGNVYIVSGCVKDPYVALRFSDGCALVLQAKEVPVTEEIDFGDGGGGGNGAAAAATTGVKPAMTAVDAAAQDNVDVIAADDGGCTSRDKGTFPPGTVRFELEVVAGSLEPLMAPAAALAGRNAAGMEEEEEEEMLGKQVTALCLCLDESGWLTQAFKEDRRARGEVEEEEGEEVGATLEGGLVAGDGGVDDEEDDVDEMMAEAAAEAPADIRQEVAPAIIRTGAKAVAAGLEVATGAAGVAAGEGVAAAAAEGVAGGGAGVEAVDAAMREGGGGGGGNGEQVGSAQQHQAPQEEEGKGGETKQQPEGKQQQQQQQEKGGEDAMDVDGPASIKQEGHGAAAVAGAGALEQTQLGAGPSVLNPLPESAAAAGTGTGKEGGLLEAPAAVSGEGEAVAAGVAAGMQPGGSSTATITLGSGGDNLTAALAKGTEAGAGGGGGAGGLLTEPAPLLQPQPQPPLQPPPRPLLLPPLPGKLAALAATGGGLVPGASAFTSPPPAVQEAVAGTRMGGAAAGAAAAAGGGGDVPVGAAGAGGVASFLNPTASLVFAPAPSVTEEAAGRIADVSAATAAAPGAGGSGAGAGAAEPAMVYCFVCFARGSLHVYRLPDMRLMWKEEEMLMGHQVKCGEGWEEECWRAEDIIEGPGI